MPQGERLAHVDVAKGIAIVAIIAGHLEFIGAGEIDWVARFVFQFHVPVFFIVSGYFLSQKKPMGVFVKQKAFRLLAPYVFTCFVMLCVYVAMRLTLGEIQNPPPYYASLRQYLLAAAYGAGTPSVATPEAVPHIGAIWFLEALFVALVVVRACLPLGKYAAIPITLTAVIGVATSHILWLPFNLQSGALGSFYVYVGTLLRKYDFFSRPFSGRLFTALSLVAIGALTIGVNVSIVRTYCGPWGLGVPVSITSSIWCVMLAQLICNQCSKATRFFRFYGANSLVVLCAHLVLMNAGIRRLLIAVGVPQMFNILPAVNFAVHLGFTALCVVGIRKTRYLRKVFY